MGMSFSAEIKGVVPSDKKYKKMYKAYIACQAAGLDIPNELQEFFNTGGDDYTPSENGMEIDISENIVITGDMEEGGEYHEIDISKLPKNVTHIRVAVCYC